MLIFFWNMADCLCKWKVWPAVANVTSGALFYRFHSFCLPFLNMPLLFRWLFYLDWCAALKAAHPGVRLYLFYVLFWCATLCCFDAVLMLFYAVLMLFYAVLMLFWCCFDAVVMLFYAVVMLFYAVLMLFYAVLMLKLMEQAGTWISAQMLDSDGLGANFHWFSMFNDCFTTVLRLSCDCRVADLGLFWVYFGWKEQFWRNVSRAVAAGHLSGGVVFGAFVFPLKNSFISYRKNGSSFPIQDWLQFLLFPIEESLQSHFLVKQRTTWCINTRPTRARPSEGFRRQS